MNTHKDETRCPQEGRRGRTQVL